MVNSDSTNGRNSNSYSNSYSYSYSNNKTKSNEKLKVLIEIKWAINDRSSAFLSRVWLGIGLVLADQRI